jgi:hypothetical protein
MDWSPPGGSGFRKSHRVSEITVLYVIHWLRVSLPQCTFKLLIPCRYLHESFQHLIVHQNFEPAIVLLDNKFSVCVAESGLAELLPSGSVSQV